MRAALRRRLGEGDDEAGLTLIELLVASAMSVILVGAVGTMVIGAVRHQPEVSERAAAVSQMRWVLERATREIRNGVAVDVAQASASSVTFRTQVRRAACGGAPPSSTNVPTIECMVTYACTASACTRTEAPLEGGGGSTETMVEGIGDSSVFCYVPSAEVDPSKCGPVDPATPPTFVGLSFRVPNPSGPGAMTISDGASMRRATIGAALTAG